MNWLDIVFLVILVGGIILGLWKGFVKQLLAIAGIFVIGIGASLLSPVFEKKMSPLWATVVAFVIFTVVYVVVSIIISKIVNKTPVIGAVNRVLGAVFAVVTVYVLFAVIVALVLGMSDGKLVGKIKAPFQNSWIVNHIYGGEAHPKRNFIGHGIIDLIRSKIASKVK